jgi:uncharacterized protein YtpQ (UPF0354 family)
MIVGTQPMAISADVQDTASYDMLYHMSAEYIGWVPTIIADIYSNATFWKR